MALEVLDAAIAVKGPEYVAIKLTPGWTNNEIEEEDVEATYGYLLDEITKRGPLMFVHFYFPDLATSEIFRVLRQRYRGHVLVDGSFPPADYAAMIENGRTDLAGFGRAFIANPDLPHRLAHDLRLAEVDYASLYEGGPRGYTDYPRMDMVMTHA
jgi:N-ethylmaleimide reductase